MKAVRVVSILVIGIAIGYAVAVRQFGDNGPRALGAAHSPANTRVAAERPSSRRAPAAGRDTVVHVDLYNADGRPIQRATGVLLGPDYTLIIPVSALKHAHRGSWIDGRGDSHPLQRVLGADFGEGIAAVGTGLSHGGALKLAPSDGTLYLGRTLTAVTPNGRSKGWVDSAALHHDDGMTYYQVRTDSALPTDTAALIDPGSDRLIGITLRATATPRVYEAVDASVITALLDNLSGETPRTLAAFGRFYARHTSQGRVDHLESLARAHDWKEVIKSGQHLLDSPADNQGRVRALLEKAYQATVTAALDRGDMKQAQNLLDQATRLLGDSASRLRLRAAVAQANGHVERARRLLHNAMDMNPALAGSISTQIRNLIKTAVVNNDQLTAREKIRLLQSEITENPDDAVYHQLLGQLYYRHADYRQAVDQLSRAVTLDSRLDNRLGPLIDNARQRLGTPGLTDVPLFGTDNHYIVNVRVNNGSRPLNFMLDTGSSYTAISAATARRLGVEVPDNGPMTPLQTANGIIEAPVITLSSLNVNGAVVNDIDVTVVKSLGQYDGLLGLSFLSHFDFNVNQSTHMLTLHRR